MSQLQTITQNRPLVNETAERLVNRVFEQLLASCPRLSYYTAEQVVTAKQQWILGFAENGITTVEQVKQGMKALRAKEDDFVPSVGKFIGWCKVVDYTQLGLPTLEKLLKRLNHFSAYGLEEADKFSFKSDAEYWLITDLYRRERRYLWQESTLKNQAQLALDSMAKRILSGEQIPPRAMAIEKPKEYIPAHPLVEAELRKRRSMKQEGWNG
nr:MAG TPA: replication protein P [Caudoviricetes sp.]